MSRTGLRYRADRETTAVALLSHREADGTIATGPYKKWQGPHWTLYFLALIGHPPRDRTLQPLMEQVYDWQFSRRHLRPPSTTVMPGQEDRVRHCASMEGVAIWSSVLLGLADERTDALVERLVEWQWPDGGWNCDRRPEARTSSFQETALTLRGLATYARADGAHAASAREAVRRGTELLLARRLLWRRRDGAALRPEWGGDPLLIQYPIRFYDVLLALLLMVEVEAIADPRCGDALDLLESKRLPEGGFPLERRTARTVDRVVSDGTFADWGPAGRRHANPWVTVEAEYVLSAAGRGVR